MNLVNYSENYFTDIQNRLLNLIVTDNRENVLSIDKALENWINICEEKRKQQGVFFFCGNGASATMAEFDCLLFYHN